MNSRLNRSFYLQDAQRLAQALLGKVLVRERDGIVEKWRIVETEAYGGATDKAAHSYGNRRTPRTETMFLAGGHLYVYLIYGMYYMLNIVANREDIPEAVLIRALEPLTSEPARTNGPGKLCRELGINKSHDRLDLCGTEPFYIIDDGYVPQRIVQAKRINVDYAEEDRGREWRFYLDESAYVSVR
jgi:DNA-3-methyladenine glycosylase